MCSSDLEDPVPSNKPPHISPKAEAKGKKNGAVITLIVMLVLSRARILAPALAAVIQADEYASETIAIPAFDVSTSANELYPLGSLNTGFAFA